MADIPSAIAHAIIGGLIFGLAAGGTVLLPRAKEWHVAGVAIALSFGFGLAVSGFAPPLATRRAIYDVFVVAYALGGMLRHIVGERLARRRARS